MKIGATSLKILSFWAMVFLCTVTSYAQLPEIADIDKTAGSLDQVVTIKGSGFGTDITQLAVFFGAAKGEVISATDQVLEVKIPAGTTYDNISVTNLISGLTGYSGEQFQLTFNGDDAQPLNINNFQGQSDFPTGAAQKDGLYDLCLCDFNGDNKVDIATANDNLFQLVVYENGSSGPGNINFPARNNVNIASRSLQVKCGDLNGDGKPDLIATASGTSDKIFILKNISTGASILFEIAPSITLTGKRPTRLEITDLDLDGKPEIIVTAQGTNAVSVLVNKSTTAAITFNGTPIDIMIPNAESSDGLAVEDINGDGLPDIITNQFQTNTDIFVFTNKSLPGGIAFNNAVAIPVGTAVKNLRAGDFDGDGKTDIAFTQLAPTSLTGIMLNQSTASTISFGAIQGVTTDTGPWGLDAGDLDGDGKLDIVAASISKKSITILNNNSTPGNISFQSFVKPTDYINRHVAIGDLDNDGKPDIAFTSIDDGNLGIPASKVSVFRNKTCMIPEVNPTGPLNVCDSNPVELVATKGGGVTYQWTNQTAGSTVPDDHTFTPTATGENTYIVTATAEGGTCVKTSNAVKVKITPGTANNPLPDNNGPVCVGQNIDLTLNNDLGAGYAYQWKDPAGDVIGTGASLSVNDIHLTDAGTYSVDVYVGDVATGCLARTETTLVEVVDVPDFKVLAESEIICDGDLKNLSVFPNRSGFTYQWFEKTSGSISGATTTSMPVPGSGEYYYEATSSNPNCPVVESLPIKISVVSIPVVAFSSPAQACVGQEVKFNNQSVSDSQVETIYSWAFGDTKASVDKHPVSQYTDAGTYQVKLTVGYKNEACSKSITKPVTIVAAPPVTILNEDNLYDLCPEKTLVLKVKETFPSYAWSTGETTASITVKEAGLYTVEVTTAIGCELKAEKEIGAFPVPVVEIIATPPDQIKEGEQVTLTASGLVAYEWAPAETLSQPHLAETTATPVTTTQYVVRGIDQNGCSGEASIEIRVKGDAIVTKLGPHNFFSPNGDGANTFWVVDQIVDYPQCSVTIYDDKGVKVHTAKPYMNDWDGTFNGKHLPDGVYYYIIRCEGEESMPRSGSITLLR